MADIFKTMFQDIVSLVNESTSTFNQGESSSTLPSESKSNTTEYLDEGDPTYICDYCGAKMWYGERIEKKRKIKKPKFSLCCGLGQVQLPLLKESPEVLPRLLHGEDDMSRYFRENIRQINMVFSFTSLGGKVDRCVLQGRGPKMFQLQGENYHLMGSLKPPDGEEANFSQLYIVDTENGIENRAAIIGKYKKSVDKAKKESLRKQVIQKIVEMLTKLIHMCINSAQHTNPETTFHMRIVSSREKDGRTYDTPTAYEVAALIPCDFNLEMDKRDIVLEEKQTGWLKRISEIHPSYLALQYPLIFTYGEDGFRLGIKKRPTDATAKLKRKNISMRQWYAFQIHERDGGSHTLLHSKRLFQQFLVDAFTTIESNRLCYLRMNQKSLRSDSFDSIQQSENYGKIDMHDQGSRFLLPVTFVGGPRYMKNMYLDAMAICKYFGFPDLFITFTCNPKWPETTRYLQPRKLSPDDRSDILCRIFKCKLDSLMDDLTEKELLGKTVAYQWEYMPKPAPDIGGNDNMLILDELSYDREKLKAEHDRDIVKLTEEQRKIYEEIVDAVVNENGGVFFVYGFGGTGKTFMWRLLSAAIRYKGEICLNTASSGIASLLLQGRRTALPRFGIPINPDEFSTCTLIPGEERIYLSFDSIDASDRFSFNDQALTPDFLNTIKASVLPNHSIRLKVSCPVMLLRNIDHTNGLMNGTRLQITEMDDLMVKAKVITGEKVGKTVIIPRISITPSDKKLSFKMRVNHYLMLVCIFQEMSSLMDNYMWLSPGLHQKKGLKILIVDDEGKPNRETINVVFKEIFQNL
uniref:ATP-dependent DNA helicase n=1 Tax=Brassica oleracea var. oleracea TaxID=109376 RepID=A0A0D3A4X1_BRAOL